MPQSSATKKQTTTPATPKGAVATVTPRGYLSYSQMALWERNPQEWHQVYILGQERPETPNMRLGKLVAKTLELDTPSDDPVLEHIRTFVPRYDKHEFELKTTTKSGVPLLCYFDAYQFDPRTIVENKTGKRWSQRMVDQSDQITFYDTAHYYAFGALADHLLLHWEETEDTGEFDEEGRPEVRLTGKIKTFDTKRTMADVFKMTARIEKAWSEISKYTAKEYAKI